MKIKKESKSRDEIPIGKSSNRVMGKPARPLVIPVKNEEEPENPRISLHQKPTPKSTKMREIKIEETDRKILLDSFNPTESIDNEMSEQEKDGIDSDSESKDLESTDNIQTIEPDLDEAAGLYCSTCEKTLSRRSSYKRHLERIHHCTLPKYNKCNILHPEIMPDTTYPNSYCGACERTYSTRASYCKHLRNVHHTSILSLNARNPLPSKTEAGLNPRNLPDTSKGNLQCGPCNKTFNYRSSYRSHLYRTHNTFLQRSTIVSQNFQCDLCEKTYSLRYSYRRHLKIAHGILAPKLAPITDSDSRFQCDVCEKSFRIRDDYRRHLKIDHGICAPILMPTTTAPYPLPIKKKVTASTQTLPDTSPRNLHCSPCDKTFNLRASYRVHLKRTHNMYISPPKPTGDISIPPSESATTVFTFQCILCEKTYDKRKSYRKHLKRTHNISLENMSPIEAKQVVTVPDTSAGNLHCDPCNKTFNFRSSYRSHLYRNHNMSITRQERPVPYSPNYYCEACKKTFSKRDTYRKHLNVIHNTSIISVNVHQICQNESSPNIPPSTNEVVSRDLFDTSAGNKHCGPCNKTFKSRDSYRWHLNNYHNIFIKSTTIYANASSFSCGTCSKTFNKRSTFRKHLNRAHNTSIVSFYARKATVNPHLVPDVSAGNLHCAPCNKTFNLRCSYGSHLKRTHNMNFTQSTPKATTPPAVSEPQELPDVSVGNLHCGPCNKTFNHRDTYRKHLKVTHQMSIRPRSPIKKATLVPRAIPISELDCIHDIFKKDRYCKLCEKLFAKGYNYRRHLKDVHKVKSG